MSVKRRALKGDKVTIKIPRSLYRRLADTIAGSGFNSVTEFIVYVLRDLVSTQAASAEAAHSEEGKLTKKEIDAIRKRLKSLGYL